LISYVDLEHVFKVQRLLEFVFGG